MITEEEEHFLRASILLLKGGRLVSKEVLNRDLQKAGGNLDIHLKRNERKLRYKFAKKHNQKLFPSAGGSDIETWDLTMIITVILSVFKHLLTKDEIIALKSLKYRRDEVFAHTHSQSLRVDEYDEIRENIETALKSLSNGLSDNLKDDCAIIIHECTKETISPSLKAELTKLLEDTEDSFQVILDKLRKHDESFTKLMNQFTEMQKEIMDRLDKLSMNENQTEKIIKVIDTKLKLSGDVKKGKAIDFVEGIVTTVINKARQKVGNDSDYPKIYSVVDKILKDIENMPDVEILPAEHMCILLRFRCTSYNCILLLLMHLESRGFMDSLNDLVLALRSTFQDVCGQLRIDVRVSRQCMKNLLDELRAKTIEPKMHERTIRVPIKVKSVQGLKHIWSLFETDKATNRLNELSEAVFEELNTEVTVTPSVDLEQLLEAIKEAGAYSAEVSHTAVEDDASSPQIDEDFSEKSLDMSQTVKLFEDDIGPPKIHKCKTADEDVQLNLDNIYTRITRDLTEAWQLPECDRKRVIRRLLFRWHPDRNMHFKEFSVRVFHHIQMVLIKLENADFPFESTIFTHSNDI